MGAMPTSNGVKRHTKYDLVGTAEAAEILEVERSRIGRWIKAELMPAPVIELKATPVWRRRDIERLLPERERRRRGQGEVKVKPVKVKAKAKAKPRKRKIAA